MCNYSCTPTKKVEEANNLDKDRIIVLLNNAASAQQLEKEFIDYQLKSTGQVSRSENRHRFEYNNRLIKANECPNVTVKLYTNSILSTDLIPINLIGRRMLFSMNQHNKDMKSDKFQYFEYNVDTSQKGI